MRACDERVKALSIVIGLKERPARSVKGDRYKPFESRPSTNVECVHRISPSLNSGNTEPFMFDPKKLESVVRKIQDAMPKPVKDLGNDVEQKIKEVIQSQLAKLDVVNREEFDVQTQVLMRTRQKLKEMEEKIASLENKFNEKRDA